MTLAQCTVHPVTQTRLLSNKPRLHVLLDAPLHSARTDIGDRDAVDAGLTSGNPWRRRGRPRRSVPWVPCPTDIDANWGINKAMLLFSKIRYIVLNYRMRTVEVENFFSTEECC